MKCPTCNGRKYIELDKVGLLVTGCPDCKGTGEVEMEVTPISQDAFDAIEQIAANPPTVEDLEALFDPFGGFAVGTNLSEGINADSPSGTNGSNKSDDPLIGSTNTGKPKRARKSKAGSKVRG